MGYSYEIHYKPGRENVVVNALSRLPGEPQEAVYTSLSAITDPLMV